MHFRTRVAVLVVLVGVVLAVPASALAIHVHVRVEGATRTLFGSGQPLVTPFTGSVPAQDGSSVEITTPTVLGALEAASRAGEFYYRLQASSFGPYVDQIGRNPSTATAFWVFKVNGVSASVGAADLVLEEGDEVLWYLVPFDPQGVGADTLDLARDGEGCVRAFAADAAGKLTAARNVVFRVDARRVRSASGRLCPTGDWRKVTATKDGTIRSETMFRAQLTGKR